MPSSLQWRQVIYELASTRPDADCIIEEHKALSFAQLVRQDDALASKFHRDFLWGKRVDVVALLPPHDGDFVLCMLACREVNAAKRDWYSLTDVGVTNEEPVPKFDKGGCPTLVPGDNWVEELQQEFVRVQLPVSTPDSLCLLKMASRCRWWWWAATP